MKKVEQNKHVHDILNLFSPVPYTKFALFELLRHLLLLVWVLSGQVLHMLHKSLHITQAK